VSEEVTEDQIMSTEDKSKPEETNPEGEGIEMQNDFDGQMFDVEKKEDDDDDDDKDKEEEEKEEIDKEMGELDPDKEEVVDEKLWDDNEEKDEPEKTGKDDKPTDKNKVLLFFLSTSNS